jgi:hypothetical protein
MPAVNTIAYFGYGSLVNLQTLQTPYISAHRARLRGWKRTWLNRPKIPGSYAPIEGLAFLSVEPCAETVIDGVIVVDQPDSLASLDRREALYDRTCLQHDSVEFLDGSPLTPGDTLYIYVARPQAQGSQAQGSQAPGSQARILRSYLDVVMRGYYGHFGEEGLQQFVRTTDNFDWPIHEDRHAPVYPRSIPVGGDEALLFERHLQALR